MKSFKIRTKMVLAYFIIISVTIICVLGLAIFRFNVTQKQNFYEVDNSYAERLVLMLEHSYERNENIDYFIKKLKNEKKRQASNQRPGEYHKPKTVENIKFKDYMSLPVCITDSNDHILFNSVERKPFNLNKELAYPFMVNDKVEAYVYVGHMFMNKELIPRQIVDLSKMLSLVAMLSIFLSFFVSYVMAYFFTRPIKSLVLATKDISNNKFQIELDEYGNDEMGILVQNFNTMAQKLYSADSARKRMTADISHELRTPVALMRGRLELIEAGIYTADEDNVTHLLAQTERLTGIIEELRQLANAEAGTLEMDIKKYNLIEILNNIYGSFLPSARQKSIELNFDCKIESILVEADFEKLVRAIGNIVQNAIKYTDENGSINIDLVKEEKTVVIKITDTGHGIDKDNLEKIFDRFYREAADRNSETGGSGLGLSICKMIIDNLGGRVYVESELGVGSTFIVQIPTAS